MRPLGLIATCVLGLEEILEGELRALEAQDVERQRGAVAFTGTWEDCWRANWRLRTANRVLVSPTRSSTRFSGKGATGRSCPAAQNSHPVDEGYCE